MTRVDSHNHTEKRAASEVLVSWFHIFVASIKEDDNKVLLLELTGEPISIIGKNYSNYIMKDKLENANIYLCTMPQIYPEDRGMNYAIRAGNKITKEILENDKNKMGK